MDDSAALRDFRPDAPRSVAPYRPRTRVLLSALIAFHIIATVVWLMPPSSLRRHVPSIATDYISNAGLWQNWGMFAPEPSNLNVYIHAIVTYQDGSLHFWSFPRMHQLDLATRYQKERYRKFEEYAHLDSFAGIWPDLARYVARQNNHDPSNPPVRVQLIRSWWEVPPPPQDGDISRDPPPDWHDYLFFDTSIDQADL